MFRAALGLATLLLTSPAIAQDVPFAEQPYQGGGNRDSMLLGLADIMGIAQDRHIKLWQAGKANNFPLVTYEAAKLSDSLYRAAALYSNIPVPLVKAADDALTRISAAADKRDTAKLQAAFADLTTACNGCHQAAGIAFIKIRVPTSSPFSNQNFAPEK